MGATHPDQSLLDGYAQVAMEGGPLARRNVNGERHDRYVQ
jgi:hypothetical protein